MKFITVLLLKIIGRTISYCNFYLICPFDWSDRLKLVEYSAFGKKRFRWKCACVFHFLHLLFLASRYWTSITRRRHDFFFTGLQAAHMAVYLNVCVLQVSFIVNGKDWVRFLNRLLTHTQKLQGEPNLTFPT